MKSKIHEFSFIKKHISMSKKIYTLFFALFFLASISQATIRYTDKYEEFYYTDRYCDIDLDGDDDFWFEYYNGDYEVHNSKPTSYFAVDGNLMPKAYASGSGMGTHTWQNNQGSLGRLDYFLGSDKYLSVRFNSGNNVYYGWVHIYEYVNHLYIGGYAYNDVPNQPITPGDRGATAIEPISSSAFALMQNTSNTISFSDCSAYDKVSVYTVDGKLVNEINHPVALQNYALDKPNSIVVVAFFKKDELLYTTKHFTK
jgi:hypothetical protein